jgi:hypothetical protein
MRNTYLYRIDVTYPQGSRTYGWEPPGWDGDNADPEGAFRWPVNRLYLSPANAEHRAALFRRYGAQATIHRSDKVTWT